MALRQQEIAWDLSTWTERPMGLFWICLMLMPVNCSLEIIKWQWLRGFAQPADWKKSIASYFAGISLSFITPNRIGEYPGRLLYLGLKNNSFRLISVSLLGMLSQLLTLFIFGALGLLYVNLRFGGLFPMLSLFLCLGVLLALGLVYLFYEPLSSLLPRIKRLERWKTYGRLLKRIRTQDQAKILGISMLRFMVYTAQYLILLAWGQVLPVGIEGFFLCALFFWSNAMIPGLFLLELGQRTQIGMYIFGYVSENTLGILTATVGIWVINLVIPAFIGSLFILRMKLIR